jgi:hypothetical protein
LSSKCASHDVARCLLKVGCGCCDGLKQDVRTRVLGVVAQGQEAAQLRVKVELSVPPDLKNGQHPAEIRFGR